MKKIRLLALPLLIAGVVFAGYQTVFSLPQQAQISSYNSGEEQLSLQCYNNEQAAVLDEDNRINLLVWNIYKQNRDTWRSRLDQYSQGKQLVLLQEASMTPQLKEWISKGQWFGSQVDAFKAFDTTAGVLNLSLDSPSKACAYTELEPWLRLPKSALYALYPLSNGQQLAVVNIHAVNFTYGTEEYHRQLKVLVDELSQHQGPVIVAGDFNSWSEQRLKVMSESLSAVGLKEVNYTSDNRTQFITGLPLDHVFYRGLKLEKAEAPISDASDHNPILVTFHL
ncbi:endonuclease/exonuclease/phosphatase family protein [Vibrio brasiliensis]|uniref:endonuclease/exonuclease/phosphatase family protein n=1 Tax=Vibrio brasiliensis TaxID=170652 RepID=UPI001EFC37C3|nr:endonuclease/exonuclease/phosphatase family protein [Vibrio brasiliensis]MCG9726094.1 endonuclease/exonuclease/phosphatase family protein [Vibrio brasiliensis]